MSLDHMDYRDTMSLPPREGRTVPVQTPPPAIRGTALLVDLLKGLQATLKTGHVDGAALRLDELLTAIIIEPTPFSAEYVKHAQRTDSQVLISIAMLLEEHLAETKRTNVRLERLIEVIGTTEAGTSSVEIDSNGSAGKIKAKIKRYAGSPVDEARGAALAEFVQLMADIEEAQTAGWKATLAAVRAPVALESLSALEP